MFGVAVCKKWNAAEPYVGHKWIISRGAEISLCKLGSACLSIWGGNADISQ